MGLYFGLGKKKNALINPAEVRCQDLALDALDELGPAYPG